ncbi:MAG: M48 family metalloprotease [Pseudomonadota bacterium]
MKRSLHAVAPLLAALMLGACGVTNPVTGEQEMGLVSDSTELKIGRDQYAPTRQSEGGDFRLDPELSAYVRQVGNRLAAVSDRKLPYEFTVVNDSTPNAWALPGGKIGINRGLLTELNSEAELAAVLSHEIVHAAARHSAQGMERSTMLTGALVAASVALGGSQYHDIALQGARLGASAVNQTYSRDAEREADFYGIQYMVRAGYDPQAAVSLQETFVRLSGEGRADWLSGLFASHPPSVERVENNRKAVARFAQAKADVGTAEYRRRLAYLRKVQPAYEAYDKGRAALKEKDFAKAAAMARKAIAIEPREALFYSLKADARIGEGDYPAALKDYDQALSRDSGYYRHFLMRGLLREELGNRAGAAADLRNSYRLLPTKTARDHLVRLSGS